MGKRVSINTIKKVKAMVESGEPIVRACKHAGISPITYRKRVGELAQTEVKPEQKPTVTQTGKSRPTLAERLLFSNLSAEDKVAVLQAVYR